MSRGATRSWLAQAFAKLDRAVWTAYGWEDDLAETSDEEIWTRLLALNKERSRSATHD